MTDIINVNIVHKEIDWENIRFVNARELHKELWVWRRFATWIKGRIEKYDFEENIDYFIPVPNSGNGVKKRSDGQYIDSKSGKVLALNYIITMDMAKELAMVENNEQWKKLRKYFIHVEKKFKKLLNVAESDPKFINQLSKSFANTRNETKILRSEFTNAIKKYVKDTKYWTYTDLLYDYLFSEKAQEYRALLTLSKSDKTRDTMYEDVLIIIWNFEASIAEKVKEESEKLWRKVSENEFIEVLKEYWRKRWPTLLRDRLRKIMSTYDDYLRWVNHENIKDYKWSFDIDDLRKLTM